ncbi:hypothetical protein [Acetobacter sp.]|uniref:hypothetical protein n=1 Tax=Acetobacter sp. TaxID=440 RepID=UPI0039E9F6D3
MAGLNTAPVNTVAGSAKRSRALVVTGYLALCATVGMIAGICALLERADILPAELASRVTVFHPYAMLLFVGVPAFLGLFGRLFLPLALNASAARGLPKLDGLALTFLLASLAVFLTGVAGQASVGLGLVLWSVGAVIVACVTSATILDARAGAGIVPPRGQESTTVPFSVFVWTQLCAAFGLLLVAPVIAAAATKSLLGYSVTMPAFELPVSLIILVAATGLATRVFDAVAPLGENARRAAVGVGALATIGGSTVWAHAAVTHGAQSTVVAVEMGLAVLVSMTCAAIWGRALWHAQAALNVPVLWMSGFFVLLVAGWISSGIHTAVLNGAIFAMFGGFYSWLDDVTSGRYSQRAAQAQFLLMFVGVVLGASASSLLQAAGGAMIVSSLLVLASVLFSLLRRNEEGQAHVLQEIGR